jgi:hypothetical protein
VITIDLNERELLTIESLQTQWAHLAHDRRDTVQNITVEKASIWESIATRHVIERLEPLLDKDVLIGKRKPDEEATNDDA